MSLADSLSDFNRIPKPELGDVEHLIESIRYYGKGVWRNDERSEIDKCLIDLAVKYLVSRSYPDLLHLQASAEVVRESCDSGDDYRLVVKGGVIRKV